MAALFLLGSQSVWAHDDDYIVGLSAFRDGLYEIAAPSLETYLSGETEKRKSDYAHYLLYQIYFDAEKYEEASKHLKAAVSVKDRRFDELQLVRNGMIIFTKTDCAEAGDFISKINDEKAFNFYLDSECSPDKEAGMTILSKAGEDATRLKVVSKFADSPEVVSAAFDALDAAKLDDNAKKYFALYFYKNGDNDRFAKVREVYEDKDVVGIELDLLWQKGDRDGFIGGFEKYRAKYELVGANACRAIDVYKKSEKEFDCSLIDECMQERSVEYVQTKGACLVKKGDSASVTEFLDSLKPEVFSGICAYGEYIFYKDLYTGKSQSRFYGCESQRYKIADVLMSKGEYQSVVNIFYKKSEDMDRYYAAAALKKLGKTAAADETASQITDESLKARYLGVLE